jgi:diphthamide synthase (EF-2-diphthine--ammonia ligase)
MLFVFSRSAKSIWQSICGKVTCRPFSFLWGTNFNDRPVKFLIPLIELIISRGIHSPYYIL